MEIYKQVVYNFYHFIETYKQNVYKFYCFIENYKQVVYNFSSMMPRNRLRPFTGWLSSILAS